MNLREIEIALLRLTVACKVHNPNASLDIQREEDRLRKIEGRVPTRSALRDIIRTVIETGEPANICGAVVTFGPPAFLPEGRLPVIKILYPSGCIGGGSRDIGRTAAELSSTLRTPNDVRMDPASCP